MNPYERQMLVPHQTSSLLREANEARLARDARRAGRQPRTNQALTASRIERVRSTWMSALASWPRRVARAHASEPDVMGHVARLSVHRGRAG
jgi:hypothetical protein